MPMRDIPKRVFRKARSLFHLHREPENAQSPPSRMVDEISLRDAVLKDREDVGEGPSNLHQLTKRMASTLSASHTAAGIAHQGLKSTEAMEDRFAPSEPIVESEAAQDKAEEEKYWGPIRRIDHSQIIDLAKNATKNPTSEWRVIKEPRGAFNQSYIVESDSQQRLNVRVPACGFHPRWNEVDAKLLHDTALGMEWIRQRTGLPIPELVSYDASLNNEIGAPYILMSYINGKPLNETWPGNGDDPAEVHEQRLKVLRQLSRLVVKFSSLQFDRFGALTFPIGDNENPGNPKDPIIDEALRLKDSNIFTIHRKFFGLPVDRSLAELVATRKEYAESVCEEKRRYHEAVAAAKNLRPRSSASVESKNKSDVVAGYHCLWAMMQDAFLAVARLGANEPEFALMQSDFNPQNILVNEDHEIVGLIDFDCTEAIPRQIAWCCVPHWLAADWNDDYMWPAEGGVLQHMSPEEFGMYRVEYCRLLREACEHDEGLSDHRFSSKSHIYRSLLSSYEDFDKIKGFVSNVMAEILPRNVKSLDSYAERIGKLGLQKGEEAWLQRRLEEYLRPDSCVAAVRTSEAQQDSPPAGGQRAGGRALE